MLATMAVNTSGGTRDEDRPDLVQGLGQHVTRLPFRRSQVARQQAKTKADDHGRQDLNPEPADEAAAFGLGGGHARSLATRHQCRAAQWDLRARFFHRLLQEN
jgi:hypothetical protein